MADPNGWPDQPGVKVNAKAECQANRHNAKEECERCGRKSGQGCGERGPYADPAIQKALNSDV